MARPSSIQRVFPMVLWMVGGAILGCSSLSGGLQGEKSWDFSRPYQTLPPARAPHEKIKQNSPVEGFFALLSPKWGGIFSPSPSTPPLVGKEPTKKEGGIPPASMETQKAGAYKTTPMEDNYTNRNRDKSSAHLLLSEAQQALANGRNQLAWKYLEQAILCDPNDPTLWQAAAMLALRANQPEMASRLASQAVERFPESVFLWQMGALARYRMGDFAGAEEAARRAISLDNRHALSYFLVGAALDRQGQASQAVAYFHQAARLDSKYAPAPEN